MILLGFCVALKVPLSKFTISITVFSPLFYTLITTKRSEFLVAVTLFLGAYLAASYLRRGTVRRLMDAKLLFKFATAGFFVVLVVIGVHIIRITGGTANTEQISSALEHMRPWVAGYLPALSVWYEYGWDGVLTWGGSILRGPLSNLGLVSGAGLSDRAEALMIGNGQTSNAGTIFKIVVRDWGPYGALLFSLYLGAVAAWCSRMTERASLVGAAVFCVIFSIIFWSPNSWFLGYGSRIFAFALALAILPVFFRRVSKSAPTVPKRGLSATKFNYPIAYNRAR